VGDFLTALQEKNQTLADWARRNRLPKSEVYAFARGRTRGKRGYARQIAIAMGVQPPEMFRAAGAAIDRMERP
jgi:gp16 family phage-associated protein